MVNDDDDTDTLVSNRSPNEFLDSIQLMVLAIRKTDTVFCTGTYGDTKDKSKDHDD